VFVLSVLIALLVSMLWSFFFTVFLSHKKFPLFQISPLHYSNTISFFFI
jgi:hypothetical protein